MKNKHTIKIDFYLDEVNNHTKQSVQAVIDQVLLDAHANKRFKVRCGFNVMANKMDFQKFSHITFFEISKGNPCFLFNSGYLHARNASIKLLNELGKEIDLPESVVENIVFFKSLKEYINDPQFRELVKEVLNNEIETFYNYKNYLTKLWFKPVQNTIYVVGGPDNNKGEKELGLTTSEKLNDAIYNYGDKDTFIDCCIFLSKHSNNLTLKRRISTDIDIDRRENLVIIGGPGSENDEGNSYCKFMMAEQQSLVTYGYRDNEEDGYYFLKCNGKEYKADTDKEHDDVIRDYGYFACFNNPINDSTRVVLINGIHTMGVLGAFKAFSDDVKAEANFKTLLDKVIENKQYERLLTDEMLEFECFFEVTINEKKQPEVPAIKPENIFFFNEQNKTKRNLTPKRSLSKDQIYGQTLKDEIIDLITIASNDTYDNDRKKEHSKLIEKVMELESSAITLLKRIKEICLLNHQIPESKIQRIKDLLQ